MTIEKIIFFGFAGWAIENLLYHHEPPFFSSAFDRKPVPFLPIYAIGGAAVLLLAPKLKGMGTVARLAAYATALSTVEIAGCAADRAAGYRSWDYSALGTIDLKGCIDLPHLIAFTTLALLVEKV